MTMAQFKVFISYSHKNADEKDKLLTQLSVLVNEDSFDLWDDKRIEVGADWRAEIEKALHNAGCATRKLRLEPHCGKVSPVLLELAVAVQRPEIENGLRSG